MTFARYAVLLAAALVLGARAADADQMLFPRLDFAPWTGAQGKDATPEVDRATPDFATKSVASTRTEDDE